MMRKSEQISGWLLRLPLWVALITLGVGLSWAWNLRTLEQHALSLAIERGRYTFKIVQATRLWVAKHGVAYVIKSEMTPSNPYLDIPEKDISTPSGVDLTAVNPAYMTRQLSGILERQHDLYVHLTSLMPLNPNNKPDQWEAKALTKFPKGEEETIELIDDDKGGLVRYMAPLFVKQACMRCHEKQGYEVGDVRGGISVSFDYSPFYESTLGQRRNIHSIHTAAWLLLNIFAFTTLRLIRRHEEVLEKARDDAEELVRKRTQELRDEVQIRRSAETQLQLLIDSTEEGIFGIDDQGCISFMNPSALNILDYQSSTEVIGNNVDEVFLRTHADGAQIQADECQIRSAWQDGISGHSEDELLWRDASTSLAIEYHVHPIRNHDIVVGAVVNFSDISVRKALQESMWRQANFDNLTGIPNRALLVDRLRNSLEQSRRGGFKVALLYIDLNAFKPVNDQYGHEAGDEVLRVVAHRLETHIRDSDTVARMGGDEFVVMLNQVENREMAEEVAEKLNTKLEEAINIGPALVSVGVSIGISLFPDDADNPDTLMAKADQSMYRVKEKR